MARRAREIGIRMALGAGRRDIIQLALWEGLAPAGIGIGVGLAAAVALGQVFAGLLFEIRPSDPLALGAVSALLGLAALLACLVPARRATATAPSAALRGD
jgi:ABC-type antimicrobial peptide transport system permease subunit